MFQSGADLAGQVFSGGGWSQPRQDTQDRFMEMLMGQGYSNSLGDVGSSLLSGRGQTALSQSLQDRGMDAMNRGGMNDQLQSAWANSGALLDPQGSTATLDALKAGGLDLFNARGMTGENSALANRGLDLANREALLPMDQVYNIAREDASRSAEGAFKRAQRQAHARKGGSASVVAAGGAENDAMSEWSDAASRSVSDAGRQALLGQQGLQLQQMGQGAGMASNALQNSLGYAGLGANAAGTGQEQESRRFLEALGLLPQISNAANSQLNTYGQLALGGGQLENARMGTGSEALGRYNSLQLGSGGLMNESLNNQGQYALGAGNLQNAFGNSYQNAGNSAFDNYLRSGAFGAGLNQNQMGAYQNLFQNTQGFNRDAITGAGNAAQNLMTLGGQGLAYAQAGLTSAPSPIPTQGGNSPWAGIGQAIGGTDFSGLFNRPPKSSTGAGYDQYNPLGGTWQGGGN